MTKTTYKFMYPFTGKGFLDVTSKENGGVIRYYLVSGDLFVNEVRPMLYL